MVGRSRRTRAQRSAYAASRIGPMHSEHREPAGPVGQEADGQERLAQSGGRGGGQEAGGSHLVFAQRPMGGGGQTGAVSVAEDRQDDFHGGQGVIEGDGKRPQDAAPGHGAVPENGPSLRTQAPSDLPPQAQSRSPGPAIGKTQEKAA